MSPETLRSDPRCAIRFPEEGHAMRRGLACAGAPDLARDDVHSFENALVRAAGAPRPINRPITTRSEGGLTMRGHRLGTSLLVLTALSLVLAAAGTARADDCAALGDSVVSMPGGNECQIPAGLHTVSIGSLTVDESLHFLAGAKVKTN